MDTSSYDQGFLGKNAPKHTAQNRRPPNRRHRSTLHEALIIKLEDLEVPSSPKKRAMTARPTAPSKITSRSAKKSSGRSQSEQSCKASARNPPATTDMVRNLTEEDVEMLRDTRNNQE